MKLDKHKILNRLALLLFLSITLLSNAQTKSIHVFVALCDNVNQGIVPVPESLGNGQKPESNLYWGAMYGVKSYFKHRASDWTFVKSIQPKDTSVLERVIFKHKTDDTYLIADAYNGAQIKKCTEDFLLATNGQNGDEIKLDSVLIKTGGNADLLAYIGHDGLMEFHVDLDYQKSYPKKPAIILACFSKDYFSDELKRANAHPVLWTTGLMAPEAYTLEGAINGWIKKESNEAIRERAAQAYNKYQKCGINGSRRLFATGF